MANNVCFILLALLSLSTLHPVVARRSSRKLILLDFLHTVPKSSLGSYPSSGSSPIVSTPIYGSTPSGSGSSPIVSSPSYGSTPSGSGSSPIVSSPSYGSTPSGSGSSPIVSTPSYGSTPSGSGSSPIVSTPSYGSTPSGSGSSPIVSTPSYGSTPSGSGSSPIVSSPSYGSGPFGSSPSSGSSPIVSTPNIGTPLGSSPISGSSPIVSSPYYGSPSTPLVNLPPILGHGYGGYGSHSGTGTWGFWKANPNNIPKIFSLISSIARIFGPRLLKFYGPRHVPSVFEALKDIGTDPLSALTREATVSLVNSYAYPDFPLSPFDVVMQYNNALDSTDLISSQTLNFQHYNEAV